MTNAHTASPPPLRDFLRSSFGALKASLAAVRTERRPRWSAWAFSSCIFLAIVCDERLVLIVPESCVSLREHLFRLTYVDKWEFFALVASFVTAIIYWADQMFHHNEMETKYLRIANLCLFTAFFAMIGALLTLFLHLWFHWLIDLHWFLVAAVAFLFLMNDLLTWQGTAANEKLRAEMLDRARKALDELKTCAMQSANTSQAFLDVQQVVDALEPKRSADLDEFKTEAYYSLFAADIPMCFGFLVLIVFLTVHWLEHKGFNVLSLFIHARGYHPYFLRWPHESEPEIDIWKSRDYFVGGAVAFQFLVSTMVYILISANVLRNVREQGHKVIPEQ